MIELIIKIVVLVLIILFLVIRNRFTKHYTKFTYKYFGKYIIIGFLMFFYLGGYFDNFVFNFNLILRILLGAIFLVFGFSLFFWAHYHLNENWSPIIEKKFTKSRSLIKTGPYKYIRHPIYTASFIVLIGFFVFTANWMLAGIPLVILGLFYISKIRREEKELIRNFGKEYQNYMKHTGGLLPKI